MVCRQSRLSSAMATFARDMSGLEDSQVLGLSHALMREHAAANEITEGRDLAGEHAQMIRTVDRMYRDGTLTLAPGSRDPRRRLTAALEENPEARRLYAAHRLIERSFRAARAQREFLRNYAQTIGNTEQAAAWEYWNRFSEAGENPELHASPAFVQAWRSNPDHTDLPVDRRSMYAFEQMEISRAARDVWAETRPAVTRTPVAESSFIQEIGYDPQGGRAEIVMNGRTYAYRLSPQEWEEFRDAPSLGRHYNQHIRHNPDVHYESAEAEAEAAVHRRCPTCGQFVPAAMHQCAVIGSEEDLNRQIRAAVERARADAAGSNTVARAAAVTPTRLSLQSTRRYLDDASGVSLRTRSITGLRQDARAHSLVSVPVVASVSSWDDRYQVTGRAIVENNGRGAGFSVRPVESPGDSGEDNLRCTCAEYRAHYTCEHVDATVNNLRQLLNGEQQLRPERVSAAADDALTSVAAESAAAAEARAVSARTFIPREEKLMDNFEKFQAMYDDARRKVQAYRAEVRDGVDPATLEYPVPYVAETGALGGLCTRESGRGMGVEIEYSFPPTMTYSQVRAANEAIGRALYEAGLTDSRYQHGYGHSHGMPPRTEHERGWSFEDDGTTGGGNFHAGGEIVSPIMYDEQETWDNLKTVVDTVRAHGGIASRGAGMHVHVGAGEYDHEVDNHNRLLAAYKQNEDLLYRMGTNPEARTHRSNGFQSPNSVPSAPYERVGAVNSWQSGHNIALNMESMWGDGDSDNVEFRVFDSSLNPGVMQAQMMMAAALTEGASRESATPTNLLEGSVPRGTHLASNPSRQPLSGQDWQTQTESVRTFIDRYVSGAGEDGGERRARQMVSLFAMTRWQGQR